MRTHFVVVLNWFGRTDTLACVESLRSGSPEAEVLVVDNGSFDGTVETLRGRDGVQVLQLGNNLGFAGGMNAGIRRAMEAGAETITVLNNDTIVPAGAMDRMQAHARGDRAVSPTVMYLDRPDEVWFGGGALDMPDAYPHHVAADRLAPCTGTVRPSQLLAGCCITASRSVWERMGLFDERFFLNFEDSEWSLRAHSRGVDLLVACDTVILHAVSASFRRSAASLGTFYFLRNGLLFTRIAGGAASARWRFLRRFAIGGMRELGWRDRARRLLLASAAAGAYIFGRYGEAPPWLQRRVRRWSDDSRSSRAI